jgi:hypothetical protein
MRSPVRPHVRTDRPAACADGEALNDEREAVGQVITGPAVELHPLAVLAGTPRPRSREAWGASFR